MDQRIKKWIFRPLPIFLIAVLVLTGTGVVLLASQQQRLVNLALRELNDQIKGELAIEKSSISLLKNFPFISIVIDQPRLYSDKTNWGKPVCEFERIYLGFSLWDIIRKKYNVRRLSIQGGRVALVRERNGTLNLVDAIRIQSDTTSDPKADTSEFEMNLQKMSLKGMDISFLDRETGRMFNSHLDKLSSSFKIDSSRLKMSLNSEMVLDITSPIDTTFFRHKRFLLDITAAYKATTKVFEISSGSFKLQDAAFHVEGSADLSEHSKVDFRVRGDKPDISLIAAFIPGDVKKILKPFQYDGRIQFGGSISGNISNGELPLIEVSFGCEDAWFLNTGADKKVDQLNFKGYYTNGLDHDLRTSELHITNISARPEKGIFKGNFVVQDFTDPHTLVQINSELELKFLGEFLGIPGLQQITGKIKLDMNFKDLTGIALPEQSLNKLKEGIQSKLSVTGLSFSIPGYPHPVRDMDLHAEMKDSRVTVDSAFLRIGNSDFRFNGTLSDIHAFLHNPEKIITLNLNASSRKIVLDELFAYDTALSRKMKEEITGFSVGLMLETSVRQFLHPAPLPQGKFEMTNLRASFKNYPHTFKDLGASLMIHDTTVSLGQFSGVIDSSDFKLSGRVKNYELWFREFKKGKTQIDFDFESTHFALRDVFGREIRKYIPRGYRRETANNVWLRAKVDMRYDTVFKFAKAEIVNITGDLKRHDLKLKNIKGKVKYGANRVLILDTLTGSIGQSDFDISLRLFAGKDKKMRKRTNSLQFSSRFLDADEISHYNLAPAKRTKADSLAPVVTADSSGHAKAFNIFMIPFSDFNVRVDIGKLKYNKLWLKDVSLRLRMQEDHYLYVDTVGMKVAGGTVGAKGYLNGSDPENIYLNSTINLEQVDLEKMLIKLDHFGQDIVINKNVKGRLSGQIKSYVQVHPNLVPIMSKTKADLKIKIYNGTLVDFAPMQAMAGYFKDKNLRMIRFDTLQNEFSFSNGVLVIPSMSINSSLGYIQVSGKQSLDLSMEYYVRVPVKMVTKAGLNSLFDKSPEEVDIDQVDEIEYSAKDKNVRFMNLKVSGTPENFKVGLGKDKSSRQ